ncbi:sensor histidine kinase [Vibrio coralliilyticus]|uniref:sensor histidine kinase n=1 Tax=Vibrio coralliilyticus TaxID=190893 RepID=UPI00155F9D10|nr:HAMP domain-containing sensor histidine kinase [Vibrio coralliilyticus]NRF30320.1 HAMP domain-containing histidine kinase [Vibrio coralliilyticus]NRF55184.1 HAMP domain-containing histidine kinase [Vibrio coralliilyticus]NRG04028.1 HAMP domain-containing histidine kinase [Vibrio coralliilyticus]
MKIRRSLRLYFLFAMLLTGSLTIIAMSGVAVSYFFSGLDMAMTGFMRTQAYQVELTDNTPVKINDLTVARRWQDLPQPIQDNLNPNELVLNEVLKKVVGVPLIESPKAGYFAMKMEHKGDVRYASVLFLDNEFSPGEMPQFIYIVFVAIAAILAFSLILIAFIRSVSTPVEELKDWAKSLDKEKLSQPIPGFDYSELNTLAEIIRSSLSCVQEGLEREQRFLGYASHELRTPIAVTRTNSELLKKMILKKLDEDKQLEVLERIERAGYTMTDLTETLLWLNRQEDKTLPFSDLVIGDLITQIDHELEYLLQGKEVKVSIKVDATQYSLPHGLCRIIITNLVRNAFQHTYQGEVIIEQSGSRLVITNHNVSQGDGEDELGFGLGLELTERLISQYGWYYDNSATNSGRRVELHFSLTDDADLNQPNVNK